MCVKLTVGKVLVKSAVEVQDSTNKEARSLAQGDLL